MTATVRPYDHGENGSGVVIEASQIEGECGPLTVWLPGSAGYPAEVSFPGDFWRCNRVDLVAMRDALVLAIRTMDETTCPCGKPKSHLTAPDGSDDWACLVPRAGRP